MALKPAKPRIPAPGTTLYVVYAWNVVKLTFVRADLDRNPPLYFVRGKTCPVFDISEEHFRELCLSKREAQARLIAKSERANGSVMLLRLPAEVLELRDELRSEFPEHFI